MNLSIIIVNYNTRKLLENCLNSLFDHCKKELENGEYEVIIVDNGSSDGSNNLIQSSKFRVQSFIKWIQNKANLGFSSANNIGIKQAKGDLILLLNSDTVIKSGSIQGMVSFMNNLPAEKGASTCKILLENGGLDPACHRGFPTPWNAFCYFVKLEALFPEFSIFSGYHQYFKNLKTIHEVDAISGAFFMTSKNVIEKVGALDEDYFMYGEDLDWCYRIKQAGYTVWYNPDFQITHFKKKSGRDSVSSEVKKTTQKHFWKTMQIFYEKHYLKKYPKIINLVVLKFLNILSK
jgi:GT2 family glycosyltransferase